MPEPGDLGVRAKMPNLSNFTALMIENKAFVCLAWALPSSLA
jgi:hypothetical protein